MTTKPVALLFAEALAGEPLMLCGLCKWCGDQQSPHVNEDTLCHHPLAVNISGRPNSRYRCSTERLEFGPRVLSCGADARHFEERT